MIPERPSLQVPGVQIDIASPLLPVMGHQASLSQCFSNLLDNAVKFVTPGTTPRIRVWTKAHGDMVRAWIEDNGIGLPKEASERIFGMFQRLHSNEQYQGTGIGLTLVRKAVERMGGKVGVESEPGRGSRFWIELGRAACE